jgi:hypothetical protein
MLSGKFLGDFQRHYDEKGYKIFDWVLETNPLAYFTALVGLSKDREGAGRHYPPGWIQAALHR